MSNEVDMPVRQAGKYSLVIPLLCVTLKINQQTRYSVVFVGVIYLKNLITSNWADKEVDSGPIEFSIHEQDRAMIRDAIVDAVVHAPDLIRQVAIRLVYHQFKKLYIYKRTYIEITYHLLYV